MTLLILYATVFIGALISVEALLRSYFRKSERQRALNDRLSLLDASEDHLKTYRAMLKARGADEDWRSLPFVQRVRQVYTQSGIKFDAQRFALYGTAGAVLIWFVVQFLVPSTLIRIPVFLVICLLIPVIAVWRIRASRIRTVPERDA